MSATVGGNFKCNHGIDTDDVNEWNQHCSIPEMGHTESGITDCVDCKRQIVFSGIPYHPITAEGKNIKLRCPDCLKTYNDQQSNANIVVTNAKPEDMVPTSNVEVPQGGGTQ